MTEPKILIKDTKNAAVISLNRPKVLNAVDSDMCKDLVNILKKFETQKDLVILKGSEKAFCAGADIVSASSKAKDPSGPKKIIDWTVDINELFFLINTYQIPLIVLVDGIGFGAGAGMMTLSKYSVVSEKAIFAMPETKFAFHPNSGGGYFFNRCKGKLGYYLGLTGERVKSTDIVKCGFATNFCKSNKLEELENQLINCKNLKDITSVFDQFFEKELPALSLDPLIAQINECFSENSIEGIFHKLKQDGSAWAKHTLKTLEKYSPSSLKVTLRQLQYAKDMDLLECLAMESNLTTNFYKFADIQEGTKALLIDRTREPQWNPSRLSDVDEELINAHFNSVSDQILRDRLHKRCDDIKNNLKYKL